MKKIYAILLSIAILSSALGASALTDNQTLRNKYLRLLREKENEKYGRPVYHFTPQKNWMNDPNGLVYDHGVWHMFFQWDPEGITTGRRAWGHAVSSDLVHWEELGTALPREEYDMYSGSAAMDVPNTLGLNTPEQATMLIAVTEFLNGQCIYYSTDGGSSFRKLTEEPVIPFRGGTDRDPRLFWYAPGKYWLMLYYTEHPDRTETPGYVFYRSHDLKSWERLSLIPGCYECPDIRELPIEGSKEKRWTVLCGNMDHIVGTFDGKTFTPTQDRDRTMRSYSNYASQTWSDAPGGRVVQISWMRCPILPERPWSQQMSIPVELSLRETPGGFRLLRYPVKETETLWRETLEFGPQTLVPGKNIFEGIEGKALDIEIEFEYSPFVYFVNLETPNGTVSVLGQEPVLKYNDFYQPLEPRKTVTLRALTDTDSVEFFANGGEAYMPLATRANGKRIGLTVHAPVQLRRARVSIIAK
ncbi:MAG: glycoside hydrolase family 32 protein [Abditibacteriota bacterium]|nr:glycoside hydrolase family 32 protein [Abditibacteriota bacterium]